MKRFNVLSPDGFHIAMDTDYASKKEAKQALKAFVNRYKTQGYYSSMQHGRMPLNMVICYCDLQTIEDGKITSVERMG
jgi:hypothetical protein